MGDGTETGKKGFYFFQVRQDVFFVGLRSQHVVASVADAGLGIELLLLVQGQLEEFGGGIEDGVLERGRNAVVRDHEESSAQARGSNVFDDRLGFFRGRIIQEGANVHGRDVESGRSWGSCGRHCDGQS